jgi:TetR/AcrR family transcriptional regulator, transcriptional repressor for nem operon
MPYPKDHKQKTRARIVETARILFNRHGFDRVTIDQVMAEAGLTRGGFYAHFTGKEELFAEAMTSFLMGRGARWREDAGVFPERREVEMARRMVDAYLSREHLEDLDGQCPMIALSSDAARIGPEVRESYEKLLRAMVWLFEVNIGTNRAAARSDALAMAALCVGGMILSRTLPDSALADEVREAAHGQARAICEGVQAKAA